MKVMFSVKNWEEFQHYKDRNPPWIKLHNHLLDDYDFECLSDSEKGHLLCIWMLASRTKNKMPFDSIWIAKKIGASSKVNLQTLVNAGFLIVEQDASKVLHNSEQDATVSVPSEEESRGETEKSRVENNKDLLSGKPDSIKVIEYMNQVLGSKYKSSTKSHIQNINARIEEGHSLEDLKMVIESKKIEWGKDPNMAQYLRPQTLFGSKFNGYLTAAKTKPAQGVNQIGSNFDKPEGW